MINKEALEYLVELGIKEDPIVDLPQGTFTKERLTRVTEPKAETLIVSTLTGLVDYIKSNIDTLPEKLLIQVKSHKEVALYSPLNVDRDREEYIRVEAILPNNVVYDRFLSTEQFNIMLQSSFVDVGTKSTLLKYTGLVQDEAVKTTGDDGVSQQVTVKTGVASVGQAIVPNPVELAPYRTFPEVEQPISKFIFRMQEGPKAAIFEADGGAWINKAILNIKGYLQEQLKELENIKLYDEDQDLLDDVLIEIHQAIEMCNIYSNILSGTMDAFASVISNNLNIVMKVLTVITIVMAIPNIIFSFYGMNVAGLPFPQWWFPTGLAIVACIIATIIFIKKDMFH